MMRAVLPVTLALAACSGGSGAPELEDYERRVARVLELPAEQLEAVYTTLPRPRELRLPLPEQSVSWGDFAELHRCDLGGLAGYRNSGLGRMQDAVERLRYEARWLAAGDQCRRVAARPSAIALAERLVTTKRAVLERLTFNAVFAGPEFQDWLGAAAGAGTASPEPVLLTLRAAVADLDAGNQGAAQIDQLTAALAQLPAVASAGPAQRSWARYRAGLALVTAGLKAKGGAVCRSGTPTPRARRLERVFRKYYVLEVQPLIARQLNADRRWLQALEALVAATPVRSTPFDRWYERTLSLEADDSEWRRTLTALRTHAGAWQAFADSCGLRLLPQPGGQA